MIINIPSNCIRSVLNDEDIETALELAKSLISESDRLHCVNRKVSKEPPFTVHFVGALGEVAYAKHMGIEVFNVNTFKRTGDFGDVEIRTAGNHKYNLIVRPDDHMDRKFVFATTEHHKTGDRTVIIHGWIYGHEAAKRTSTQPRGGGPPAWFVPPWMLNPIIIPKAWHQ